MQLELEILNSLVWLTESLTLLQPQSNLWDCCKQELFVLIHKMEKIFKRVMLLLTTALRKHRHVTPLGVLSHVFNTALKPPQVWNAKTFIPNILAAMVWELLHYNTELCWRITPKRSFSADTIPISQYIIYTILILLNHTQISVNKEDIFNSESHQTFSFSFSTLFARLGVKYLTLAFQWWHRREKGKLMERSSHAFRGRIRRGWGS